MAARPGNLKAVNEYEQQRLDRIAANQAKLDSIGVLQQKILLENSFCAVRQSATASKPPKVKGLTPATRQSQRLQKVDAENVGLVNFPDDIELRQGKAMLSGCGKTGEAAAWLYSKERRCGQKGRGSIYDNVAGITCHFCRQKKLCGEEDCGHCSERDVDQVCIGKSECSRCESACGRFCRACLLVRYGLQLEAVREQMANATWLCPHCYEEDQPEEDWICNSSICMTKRGLKPTGIAIFEAQQQGFASVAHYVQAQLASRKGRQAAKSTAASETTAAAAAETPVALERTHSLALTPDSAAVGKDGQPDPLFARKAGNAVERRHASDRACSKVRGQAGEQEGADGSSKASVQRERKKNAPVDICDHGLEAVAMPPAKEGSSCQHKPHKRNAAGARASGILGYVVPRRRSAIHA
ncbi:hypothetical protein WJX82_011725 [Trebouxia sp. C0006]